MIFLLAPHVDDEIIGCFSILKKKASEIHIQYVYRLDSVRKAEAMSVALKFDVMSWGVGASIPNEFEIVLAPDPYFEFHPSHRHAGSVAMNWHRNHSDKRLILYSTNMNAPYLKELSTSEQREKKELLDQLCPSQKSLWEYDHRYFLFEGLCEVNPRL